MELELSIDEWDAISPDRRLAIASEITRRLPKGFSFRGVHWFEVGASRHHVAQFEYAGSTFSFVPGGQVAIGFDAKRWMPSNAEVESYVDSEAEYGLDGLTIDGYVERVTGRRRDVELPAALIETRASESVTGIWSLSRWPSPANRRVRRWLRRSGRRLDSSVDGMTFLGADGDTRVRRGVVEKSEVRSHEDVVRALEKDGFRLPSENEWEYACGAGSGDLFRWGDHAPADRYPTEAVRYHTDLAFPADWDHRVTNSLGIRIAEDPYRWELTQDPSRLRGGDGGGSMCGGVGFYLGWLTLATAFVEPDATQRDADAPLLAGFTIARRVLPLDAI